MQKENLVMPVEVYSRVVGYFRPVNQWNVGKKEEFKQRQTYAVDMNQISEVCENEYQRAV